MATYNFTFTKVSTANQSFLLASNYGSVFALDSGLYYEVANTLDLNTIKVVNAIFPDTEAPATANVLATSLGYESTFNDGVYKAYAYGYSADDATTYTGTQYLLVTDTIDCGITNLKESCEYEDILVEVMLMRESVDVAWGKQDYTQTNFWIKKIQKLLVKCGCNC